MTGFAIWSIICAIVALLVLPPIVGGLAIYLAYRAKKAGDQAGDALMMVSVGATVAGIALGIVMFMSV